VFGTIVALGVAVLIFLFVMRVGLAMLRSLSTPAPEPPPPGELRRVKMEYRCEICGAELRMTLANDEQPEPPRHCMEEMVLQARHDV
jgi:hypothetical protein